MALLASWKCNSGSWKYLRGASLHWWVSRPCSGSASDWSLSVLNRLDCFMGNYIFSWWQSWGGGGEGACGWHAPKKLSHVRLYKEAKSWLGLMTFIALRLQLPLALPVPLSVLLVTWLSQNILASVFYWLFNTMETFFCPTIRNPDRSTRIWYLESCFTGNNLSTWMGKNVEKIHTCTWWYIHMMYYLQKCRMWLSHYGSVLETPANHSFPECVHIIKHSRRKQQQRCHHHQTFFPYEGKLSCIDSIHVSSPLELKIQTRMWGMREVASEAFLGNTR